MNNSKAILLQILTITTGSSKGKERDVADCLTLIEMQVMTALIAALPQGTQTKIIDQWLATPDVAGKAEKIFSPYYTREDLREALKKATKQVIAQQIVEPLNPRLTPSQRERILALLAQLTS
jgi:hypothetical protein